MRIILMALAAVLALFAGCGMAHQKIPVIILNPETGPRLDPRSAERIVKLVRDYYRLDSESSRYFQLKVEPGDLVKGIPRELLVYRFYRDVYLYETDRLIIDKNFSVLRVDKNIQK
ncbi:MAG: hypothetical protein M0036_03255 [Desulfobacteraceae bacterium]|nr:hypothetical protein [Desulfobacteraceae bacterium]